MQLFLAQSQQERDSIYRLRYQAYLAVGAIHANKSGRVVDDFDERPGCYLFGVQQAGCLLGAIRVLVSTSGGRDLTAYGAFADAIDTAISPRETVLEANRFVVNKPMLQEREGSGCVEQLFRTVVIAWRVFQADQYIAAVRQHHVRYYCRHMLMTPISDPCHYPGLLNTPMVLLCGRCRDNYAAVCQKWGAGFVLANAELDAWGKQLLGG